MIYYFMLKIRLARIGKKKRPTYRFIVSEQSRDTYGRYLEVLGNYNPFSKVCEVNKDRILYWISKGAQISPTAHNLFVDQNVISGPKVKASAAGKKAVAENAEAKTEKKPVEVKAENAENKTEAKPAEKAKPEEKKEELKVEEVKPVEEKAIEEKAEKKTEEKLAEPAA